MLHGKDVRWLIYLCMAGWSIRVVLFCCCSFILFSVVVFVFGVCFLTLIFQLSCQLRECKLSASVESVACSGIQSC